MTFAKNISNWPTDIYTDTTLGWLRLNICVSLGGSVVTDGNLGMRQIVSWLCMSGN